jgi:hypothetical protein
LGVYDALFFGECLTRRAVELAGSRHRHHPLLGCWIPIQDRVLHRCLLGRNRNVRWRTSLAAHLKEARRSARIAPAHAAYRRLLALVLSLIPA